MKHFGSILELRDFFNSEDRCRKHLEEVRWGGKPACPHCGNTDVCRFADGKTFKCRERVCRKKFTVTVGTVWENTKLPLQKWFIATYLITCHKKGISSVQLAEDIGVTQETAWFVLHRVREMQRELKPLVHRMVSEADETYVGGKNRNRHADKKVDNSQGRSTKDKTPVFGVVQRHGRVTAFPVTDVSAKTLKSHINELVEKGSIVITDELGSYNGLSGGYSHAVVKHNAGEYVRGYVHSNTIENFWSCFKRGLNGTYHSVSRKHLKRYCDEFTFRYNERGTAADARFHEVLGRCERRLKYRDLIATPVIQMTSDIEEPLPPQPTRKVMKPKCFFTPEEIQDYEHDWKHNWWERD